MPGDGANKDNTRKPVEERRGMMEPAPPLVSSTHPKGISFFSSSLRTIPHKEGGERTPKASGENGVV